MAKQVYTTGQILTAAQMTTLQANDYNQTVSAKTASYTLVAADAGTRITMNNASATTITVNTSIFTAGDTLEITNIGAGVLTITAGTATVSTSSTLALKQFDSGQLYFTSTGVAIFFASDAADSPLTTKGDLFTFSTVDARLAVGTNDYFLQADSAQATGLKYGGALTASTPVLSQSVTVATSTANMRHIRIGNMVYGSGFLVASGTGTAANRVKVTLPVTPQIQNVFVQVGNGTYYDASSNNVFPMCVVCEDGTNFNFTITQAIGANGLQYVGLTGFTAAVAVSDQIGFTFSYEVA